MNRCKRRFFYLVHPIVMIVACLSFPLLSSAEETSWENVQRAAEHEGEVTVVGPAFQNLRQAVTEAFTADTSIKVNWKPLISGPGPFQAQLRREVETGQMTVDVYIGGSNSCHTFTETADVIEDLQDVLLDPEVLDGTKWRHGELHILRGPPNKPHHFWCALNTTEWVMGDLFVNTRQVDPGEITSWRDLLRPEFKGRIVAHDPRHPGGGRATAAYLFALFGPEFIKNLYIDQEADFVRSYGQAPEGVARGKYAVGIGFVQAAVEPLRRVGLPVKRVFPEDGPGLLTGGFASIMKFRNSPNSNAGAVFINWWASARGQQIVQCELMELSLRIDLEDYSCVPEWVIPKESVNYPIHDYAPRHYFGEYNRFVEMTSEIFGR